MQTIEEKLRVDLAEEHLQALGIGKTDPVSIGCNGRFGQKFFPPRDLARKLPYEWVDVCRANANGREEIWKQVQAQLESKGSKDLFFIPSPGGTSSRDRKEIFAVTVLVYEIDYGLKKEEQWGAWERAGLPTPTLVVDSGNKSLHVYYLLKSPCGVEAGQHARKRLSAAIEAAHPGIETDPNIWAAGQPMRLAGGIHPKSGQQTTIALNSGNRYSLEELMAVCPEVEEEVEVVQSDFCVRPDPESKLTDEWLPDFPIEGMTVPLEIALTLKTQRLLEKGMNPESDQRWKQVHRLGKVLRAARLQLEQIGQPIEGGGEASEIRLLTRFIEASEIKGGDVDAALAKHWRPEPCGETELSDLILKRFLKQRALREGLVEAPIISNDFWEITPDRGVEVVLFEGLMEIAEEEGRPITCYQRRFLQYNDQLGFFEPRSVHAMQQQMLELLPLAFKPLKSGTSRSHVTAHRAKACTEFAALKLHEERMDLVPAIAFRNGTYMLNTCELVPHSPAHKLTWAVNAEFVEGADCPPVMREFIASSFGSEWEPIIQIVLRYLVDPEFKCSKIVMLLGASGSGKGTLERLIEKLFPPSVISIIPSGFKDINNPDKIQQFVTGKRLVAFPDLQGKQMGVGVLYSLTDGGKLTGRALFQAESETAEPFKGRVVICSTQPPLMDDAGNGLTRRMLVLPTSRPAGMKPDLDLDEKLEAELGQIVSWALQATRQQVKELLAGGDVNGLLRDAARGAEINMDPVRRFVNHCLVPKPGNHFPDETLLFKSYQVFCKEQNHRATAQRSFLNRLEGALPHLRTRRRSVPGSNSRKKTRECFYGFDVQEDLITFPTSMINNGPQLDPSKYVQQGYEALQEHRPEEPDVMVVVAHFSNPDTNCPARTRSGHEL